MVRVKTFLGCIQMETGGLCLGWFFFTTFLLLTALLFVFGLQNLIATRKILGKFAGEPIKKVLNRF